MMQALVIAHAAYGHNSFFKGNYLFRAWTSADAIIDYLLFARNYVAECEERHGEQEVELFLDSCHALMNYGWIATSIRRRCRCGKNSSDSRAEAYLQSQSTICGGPCRFGRPKPPPRSNRLPERAAGKPLYFIEKNAPLLEPWQREIVRIVRKIAQYFYPQRQTQVMNEGWATFWHYTLMNRLYDEGYANDGFMIEFLQSHTSVIQQLPFDHPYYSGINPYALGFAMMSDIRRICQEPTAEDRHWFPNIAGQDWIKTLDFAMRNFRMKASSPSICRPRSCAISNCSRCWTTTCRKSWRSPPSTTRPATGGCGWRWPISTTSAVASPIFRVWNVAHRQDRSLTLRHTPYNRRPLHADSAQEVLKHLHRLWGFTVRLETVDEEVKRN